MEGDAVSGYQVYVAFEIDITPQQGAGRTAIEYAAGRENIIGIDVEDQLVLPTHLKSVNSPNLIDQHVKFWIFLPLRVVHVTVDDRLIEQCVPRF